MQLIDDSGNLFGLVNVVDALVVLLALAVGVAGVALVTADDGADESAPELSTTNATLDLGTQPEAVAAAIEAGDTHSPGGNSELTVTDVHVAPQGGDARVHVRVRLRGQGDNGTVAYDGAPPRLDRSLKIQTDSYAVSGTVQSTGGGAELPTRSTPVLIERTATVETAAATEAGQTIDFAGRDVATIESVTSYRTGEPGQRRLAVGIELVTVGEDRPRFGGQIVNEGATIPLTTTDHNLTGTVERVGATEPRGEATTREVTLEIDRASPELAAAIEEGDAERVDGRTVAEITGVERENATVVVTSDDGNVYLREHPVDQQVTITADLAVRETADGVLFRGQRIQRGSTVRLDLGDVTVEATVRSL
ncbi:DUF4330 domain-containing protein [Halomicrobium salinisoli]|uniref:DUF4330 domain-containing protein n=1 Tax=Halomicrobium salinisoli TaxID=2878391 RepID=UPI001CF0451E|nr:DUF4330 domain-containing protein [Halomicrobium salinisoli]